MKKTLLAIALGATFAVGMQAQEIWTMNPEVKRLLMEDNRRAGNNTHSYEFDKIVDTPAPKGYKPVYISHYGRHGSRSNWGSGDYNRVIDVLTKAKEAGILTASGDSLLSEAKRVLASYDGMDGRLTQRGVREHEQLAARMYDRFTPVFKGRRQVRAVASTSQRCIVSMTGFLTSLGRKNHYLEIHPDTGEKMMDYISHPDAGKNPPAEVMMKIARETASRPVDTVTVMKRLFTDQAKAHQIVGKVDPFQNSIVATASIAEDFDIEENVYRYLPIDVIYRSWSSNNKFLYYHNGNSPEYGRNLMPASESLVKDIITKADDALERGDIAADLRFGHDYPILNLVCHLGIEGVGDTLEFDEIDNSWWGFRNLPMASNLQMIFYRNKAGHTLVKILYQEKECKLRGLEPVSGPYYDWDTFKQNAEGWRR